MNYQKTNGDKIEVFGIPTSDKYKKGEQKPVIKPKAPQYIDNKKGTPIQYIDWSSALH